MSATGFEGDLVFPLAPGAVSDAGEALIALAAELEELGAETRVTRSFESPGGKSVFVFAPGDWFGVPGLPHPNPVQLDRSIALCEGAPGGTLDPAFLHARRAAAALCADPTGAARLHRNGIPTHRLQIGGTGAWDRWRMSPAEEGSRPIDVACLAARNAGADRLLASYAISLWRHSSCLRGAPEVRAPTGSEPSVNQGAALGEERLDLLRRTQVLLAGFGGESNSIERIRVVQAALNGAVVLAPHGFDAGPDLAPSVITAEARNLGLVAAALLRDRPALDERRRTAYGLAQQGDGWTDAAEWTLQQAQRILNGGDGRAGPSAKAARLQAVLNRSRDAARDRLRPPPDPARVAAKRRALEEISARRASVGETARRPREVMQTPAYADARPLVSVCIPAYEHAEELRRAVASVTASELRSYEVLILDDASRGPVVPAGRDLLDRYPWLPAVLLRREANCGVGRGRNDMAQRARGEFVFMLDADNEVYPTALGRFADALGRDAGAAFAYSMIEVHTEDRPRALLSAMPWEPSRLRLGNYIDAMSMIRRDALLDAGGYTEDLELHGWEDFDLWCRFAALGLRGRLVPEILCRYSFAAGSMIATTNLDSSEAWATLRERYPSVLGGAPEPVYPPPPPDVAV